MRAVLCLSSVLVLMMVVGCASIAGTWTADKSSGSDSPIASVSFCQDGTFTAHAEYGNNRSHAMSGHYEVEDGTLELETEGNERSYDIELEGDTLTITHMGASGTLVRMKKRDM